MQEEINDLFRNEIIYEDMINIFHRRNSWEELKNKKIYITGSTGMLASYFIYFLIYLNEYNKSNIKIIAGIRNLEKAKKIFGKYMEKEYFHIYKHNILDEVYFDNSPDYIIHAASLASPQYYGKMPVETILPNVIGTYRLLEYARHNEIESMIFFSSGDVYGTVGCDNNITESTLGTLDNLAVGSFYGESKRCGETMCKAYFLEYGIKSKYARIAHTYGPTMDWKNDKRVFSEFVSNIVKNEDIVMKSDGMAKRPFAYITDTISALLIILLDGENGEAYNVGNDEEFISIKNLAEILVKLYPEKKLKVCIADRHDYGYCQSKEFRKNTLSMDKLRKLGWNPSVSVEEGFSRVIDSISKKYESVI